jgi:hypothetical protein
MDKITQRQPITVGTKLRQHIIRLIEQHDFGHQRTSFKHHV